MWAIWKGRNQLVFDQKPINIQSVISQGMYWFNTFYFNDAPPTMQSPSNARRSQQWSSPKPDTIKVNVDASWRNIGSSCVLVARNDLGKFICAKSDTGDIQSPLAAEASGFLLAMTMAYEMKFKKIIIEGDAKMMIQALNGGLSRIPWRIIRVMWTRLGRLLRKIVDKFDQVQFSSIRREANEVAHRLAAYAFKHYIHQSVDIFPTPASLPAFFPKKL
ncbi:uncharacterized protein LOC113279780 [Papaver somniferum]|uniref:uncharacterized protein LOC113279780 n=1 Tax=Papaver somniferum TaxID=3469 RepID=UPI000E705DA5|nr:uncharacterized protein LOC113279780 [Papaver somniferum]